MRYQRLSPDFLPLSNGRRSNVQTWNDAESGKVLNYNGFRPGSIPSTGHDPNSSQFVDPDSLQLDNHTSKSSLGGDVLLQWGHNKRKRQVIKIHQRVAVSGLAKQMKNQLATEMPRRYIRGTNLRPCIPAPETTTAGSLLNRNLEDRSDSVNGAPSRNGNGRIHSRSSRKRSPPSSERADKASSCSVTTIDEKLNESILQTIPMNVESVVPQLEAEKLNLDQLEWPRIYISLSRKEKEDDFLVMKGTKLPQRPKKRAKNLDRALEYCYPGMWLSDLTRGRYEVREKKRVKKKRRGLKGIESMDSESQ